MKTEVIKTVEGISDYLDGLSSAEIISVWNRHCEATSTMDDRIYNNDEEFFEQNFSKVMNAVRAIFYGTYSYGHSYVVFNGYGNLDSFDNPLNRIALSEIMNSIMGDKLTVDGVDFTDPEQEEEEEN